MTTVNERITRLVKLALSNKQSKASVFIGKIPHDVAAKVQECCKRNILGYSVFMDTDAIRHVRNEDPNVELRDFLLIPLILKEPIAIKAGSQKTPLFSKRLWYWIILVLS